MANLRKILLFYTHISQILKKNLLTPMRCMTFTRYDLQAGGHFIKTIFNFFSYILAYYGTGTNLRYIPVVIPKSARPNNLRNQLPYIVTFFSSPLRKNYESMQYCSLAHCNLFVSGVP
jgi:hypothetical protein